MSERVEIENMKIGSKWFYAGGGGGGVITTNTNAVLVLLMMMTVATSTVASRTPISMTLEQHISDDPDLSQVLLFLAFFLHQLFFFFYRSSVEPVEPERWCISDY